MSLSIEIQKKTPSIKQRKVRKPSEVFNLEEVQEIKDAIQEHLLFIGVDRRNNVKNVTLLGVGSSAEVNIDCKYILRTALVTASDGVILVHNHPSNEVKPSNLDKEFTNMVNKFLEVFNIKLVDHVIVSENDYVSMQELNAIDKDYENYKTNLVEQTLLIDENKKLKEEVKSLTDKLQTIQNLSSEDEEEFE